MAGLALTTVSLILREPLLARISSSYLVVSSTLLGGVLTSLVLSILLGKGKRIH